MTRIMKSEMRFGFSFGLGRSGHRLEREEIAPREPTSQRRLVQTKKARGKRKTNTKGSVSRMPSENKKQVIPPRGTLSVRHERDFQGVPSALGVFEIGATVPELAERAAKRVLYKSWDKEQMSGFDARREEPCPEKSFSLSCVSVLLHVRLLSTSRSMRPCRRTIRRTSGFGCEVGRLPRTIHGQRAPFCLRRLD